MNSPYTDRFATVNGLRLHYQEWGRRGAPGVVLVHGWSTSAPIWHEVAEALSSDYHVVAPDNRGNGESQVPVEGFRISDYASDLVGLIDAAGLEQSRRGRQLVGRQHRHVRSRRIPGAGVEGGAGGPGLLEDGRRLCHGRPRGLVEGSSGLRRPCARRPWRRARRQKRRSGRCTSTTTSRPKLLLRIAVENRDWALACEDYLARAAAPTLLLVADPDAGGYISETELRHLSSVASPLVETRLWKGVGHLMHGEAPDRFVREVRAFLEGGD